jgi:polar amino acid transport system permease protein
MRQYSASLTIRQATDLPVLLPFRWSPAPAMSSHAQWFMPGVVAMLLGALAVSIVMAPVFAQPAVQRPPGVVDTLMKWTPLLFWGAQGQLGGFVLNVLVSFLAMAIGTVLGLWLGLAQLSRHAWARRPAWLTTQLFRNSPWLVLLFYCMLLLPFQIKFFGWTLPLPGWAKATLALSLPIMANISEIVRGAVNSIPAAQWESAESLAFTRRQTMWMIVLPQCVKRMLPPWMNWYQILAMATPLISILGVDDCLRLTRDALAAEGRSEYLIPMYLWIMTWFFIYCYPIARGTHRLERRWAFSA